MKNKTDKVEINLGKKGSAALDWLAKEYKTTREEMFKIIMDEFLALPEEKLALLKED